jgi:hypothetical protein
MLGASNVDPCPFQNTMMSYRCQRWGELNGHWGLVLNQILPLGITISSSLLEKQKLNAFEVLNRVFAATLIGDPLDQCLSMIGDPTLPKGQPSGSESRCPELAELSGWTSGWKSHGL